MLHDCYIVLALCYYMLTVPLAILYITVMFITLQLVAVVNVYTL